MPFRAIPGVALTLYLNDEPIAQTHAHHAGATAGRFYFRCMEPKEFAGNGVSVCAKTGEPAFSPTAPSRRDGPKPAA